MIKCVCVSYNNMNSNLRNGRLLALVLLFLQSVIQHVQSLSCYKCTILPPPPLSNNTERLCSHFDASSKYIVDCPYSTFCMKKTFELSLQKGASVRGIQRDCASQRNTYQTFDSEAGRWVMQDAIVEGAYEPGCQGEGEVARGVKSASSTFCYCRSNLCNAAKPARGEPAAAHHTDAMAVIFVFNAMKYIRSLR